MTKNTKIIIIVVICLVIIGIMASRKTTLVSPVVEDPTKVTQNSIAGCYVMHSGKDVYILIVESEEGKNVTGKVSFNNFEKDSSSGSFTGKFDGTILLGNYSFDSEGMHSNRQLVFKLVDGNLIEGFGDVKFEGGKEVFKDISAVTYNPQFTFGKSSGCR